MNREPDARPSPISSRSMALVVVIALFAAACTGGGSLGTGTSSSTEGGSSSTASQSPIPEAVPSAVVAQTRVGTAPTTVVAGGGSLWVADDFGVERIDPSTNEVVAGYTLGPVGDVAVGHEGAWILGFGGDRVGRVDPATDRVTIIVKVDQPTGIAVGAGAVWVSSLTTGVLTELEPATGKILARTVVDADPPRFFSFVAEPTGIAFGAGSIWVADPIGNEVVRIDASTADVTARIPVGGGPLEIIAGNDQLWVAAPKTPSVVRIDPATNEVVASVAMPAPVRGLTIAPDGVWAAGAEGTLVRIDPETNQIVQRLDATEHLSGVTVLDGDLITAVHDLSTGDYYNPGSTVVRIDPKASAGSAAPILEPSRADLLPVAMTRDVNFTPRLDCTLVGSSETCRLRMDVLAPLGARHLPTIVLAHGGPCGAGCRAYLDQQASGLALDGALVFNIDYRDDVGTPDQQTEDIACGIAFARTHATEFGGDPGRVTLVGHSLGSIRGGVTSLEGRVTDDCLAQGSGLPDAFIGIGANPVMPTLDYGRNADLEVRLVIGSHDDASEEFGMKGTADALLEADYDVVLTIVRGANHFSAFGVGTACPTFGIILDAARDTG